MGQHRAFRPPGRARGVEDHGGVFFADLDRRCQRRVIGQIRKAREFRIIIDRDPVRHIGNVARIGHTVGQRGLVDQEPRAAIGEHIGDLGLLLAGRKQHRHQPGMRRAQHRQHEFGSVAEQHRDAVAALQAELLKSCRDLRRLPRDFAPGHSRVRRRPAPRHRRFAPRLRPPSPGCSWAARKMPERYDRRSAARAASVEWRAATSPWRASSALLHLVDMFGSGESARAHVAGVTLDRRFDRGAEIAVAANEFRRPRRQAQHVLQHQHLPVAG